MTLSELAALGSFVSGAAVVVTLIFLLVKVRQNTAALLRSEANATHTAASVFQTAIINSRDVARLLTESLSKNDPG